MTIGILSVVVLALLVVVRVHNLVGRDGAVHYGVPGLRRSSAYRKTLERIFGTRH